MAKKEAGLQTGIDETKDVDAFMRKLKHPLRDVAERLRTVIRGVDARIGEGIFWKAPVFYFTGKMPPFDPKTYGRYVVGFNFYRKDRVRLIFLRGAKAKDPSGLLEGEYEDGRRLAQFRDLAEAKRREKDLKGIVKQLVRAIPK